MITDEKFDDLSRWVRLQFISLRRSIGQRFRREREAGNG